MAKFGINPRNNLGLGVKTLRSIAKEIGMNHELAKHLWQTDIHDARMLAALIADPRQVTESLMESWIKNVDSWDLCDMLCYHLLYKTSSGTKKITEWTSRSEEFVKRAGFVLMVALAVHDKTADDAFFESFLPIIRREASDDRQYVKKAVNWALRAIGKRNQHLHGKALQTAHDILKIDAKSARWIARDAIRELNSEKIKNRLQQQKEKET
jgi:3-methyladenine DNA glycosylase AlkD